MQLNHSFYLTKTRPQPEGKMELEGHCCRGFPDFRRPTLQLERHCACPARGWRGHFKLVARYIAVETTFREVEPKRSSTARAPSHI